MKKRIILVGHRRENMEVFSGQIKSLFGDRTEVQLVLPLEEIPALLPSDSIVVATCYDIYSLIEHLIPENVSVMFSRTTVQPDGLRRLVKQPEGNRIVVVSDHMETSNQLLACLLQLGITHLRLKPADLSKPGIFCNEIVACAGLPLEEIKGARQVIDLRAPMLDMATVLDLGVALGKPEVLSVKNVAEDYRGFIPVHAGITWCLEGYNRVIGSGDILLNMIDGAIISVEQDGTVKDCNTQAEVMFDLRAVDTIGKKRMDLFSQLPFENALRNGEEVNDVIRIINEENMIVTVRPIINSGKRYGAVAVVKRFKDEEKRYNKLRRSLIDRGYRAKYRFEDIIGHSAAMEQCLGMAKRMAASNSSMLILGESGTGKEMFAQAVHNASERRGHQFVAVNCGAIPESLLESELFGYSDGAFTGAKKGGKAGLFELANKGTIFLDEISEMQLTLQKRLLRVLQEREVTRLGGDSVITVDIRLIAATNRDLREMVRNNEFREDLYYRLNVLPLSVPPLRNRTEDIRDMVDYFIKELKGDFVFTEEAYEALESYYWRGNVRELRNYVEFFSNYGVSSVGLKELEAIFPVDDRERIVATKDLQEEQKSEFYSKEKTKFILENLRQGLESGKRLGRRSLCEIARKEGLFLGEQEIRRITIELEKRGLVEVHPNKAGTVITPKGLRVLKQMK